jgi:hypothetical protein
MHPLTPDLSGLTDAELQKKFNDLNVRLSQAYRMGNGGMIAQVRNVMEDYNFELQRRHQKTLEEMMAKSGNKFDGIIDIQ